MPNKIQKTIHLSNQAGSLSKEILSLIRTVRSRGCLLDRETDEISRMVDVLLEISEQTNLLAVNASIESGRIGTPGKRFAVTVNEMTQLAGQTTFATEELKKKCNYSVTQLKNQPMISTPSLK